MTQNLIQTYFFRGAKTVRTLGGDKTFGMVRKHQTL